MSDFKKEFNKWKIAHGAHGPRALTRFVMVKFIEALDNQTPGKYIFKGGNLLWFYIKTPRPTVDIDFSTEFEVAAEEVIQDMQSVSVDGCSFKVTKFDVVESD